MMGEIIEMLAKTVVDRSPDAILRAAIAEGFESVIVIGETKDGSTHISMSPHDYPTVVYQLELAKHTIMDQALTPEEDG